MPWIVDRLTCSNDVHVELLRSLQPPLEDQVVPDERSREVASAWLSLVTSTPTEPVPLSNTGSCSLGEADACAAAVVTSKAVAAVAATTSARTTSFRIRSLRPTDGANARTSTGRPRDNADPANKE